MNVSAIREVAAALLETNAGDEFDAACVLLAPIATRSFHPDRIAVLSGLNVGVCRAVAKRCMENGIWQHNRWRATWPELFTRDGVKMLKRKDERADRLLISFVLDTLVASGSVARFDGEDDFLYQYAASIFDHGIRGDELLSQLRRIGARRERPSSALRQLGAVRGSGVFADLGCGDSADAAIMRRLGYQSVRLDLYPSSQTLDADFVQATVTALPLRSQSVDVAVCQAVMALVRPDRRESTYREFHRVLKPGGKLCVYLQPLKNGWELSWRDEQRRAESAGLRVLSRGQCFTVERPPILAAVSKHTKAA